MFRPITAIINKIVAAMVVITIAATATSCHTMDSDRIPRTDVYLPFNTKLDWELYGVSGAATAKRFIKSERIPANYPYPALSYTGFGGILLCADVHGEPVAYDLACPVEVKPNVRLVIDNDLMKARCPRCGSVYDIYTNYGAPVSGPAAEYSYGLQRYLVMSGVNGIYKAVTRNNLEIGNLGCIGSLCPPIGFRKLRLHRKPTPPYRF